MKGERVHVLEKGKLPGGACDGYKFENLGYVMRGGREMDNHFEVMWDLFHSIPSIETEGVSVLDEYYWLNKEDPNYSLCRATVNRGQDDGLRPVRASGGRNTRPRQGGHRHRRHADRDAPEGGRGSRPSFDQADRQVKHPLRPDAAALCRRRTRTLS